MTVWLRLMVALSLVAASLAGCQGKELTGPADGTDRFVFQTDHELAVVDGVTVVARLPRGTADPVAARIPVTEDGRFLYALGESSVSVLDTASLRRTEIPCAGPCPRVSLGASLVGWFDAASDADHAWAAVHAIDLAAAEPTPSTLGRIRLPRPGPATAPYSYFLDATPGHYLFFATDADTPDTAPLWEQPQTLYRAQLDGTTIALGRYDGFARAIDVWAVVDPGGSRVMLNSGSPDPTHRGCAAEPGYAPLDVIDLASGHTVRIHPPAPGSRHHLRATRAWWGNNGTAYVAYRPAGCDTDDSEGGPPPSVWAYRDGSWSQLDTGGPAIFALPLAGGRLAVVAPAGRTDEAPHGTLMFIDAEGNRTHIADGVTAIAPLPARPAG